MQSTGSLPPQKQETLQVNLDELCQIIGAKEVTILKLNRRIGELLDQLQQADKIIAELRSEDVTHPEQSNG